MLAPTKPPTSLRLHMTALGVSTAQLAEAVGITHTYGCDVVAGRCTPSRRLKRSIADALSLPEHLIFEETP